MRASRRAFARKGWLPVALMAAAFSTDCTSDHASLAARPSTAGAGGKASAAGAPGGRAGSGGRSPTGKGGTGGIPLNPDKHVEPVGRSVFTLVHGIVDADRVAWCFARVRDGATKLAGEPLPDGGIGYGQSFSFEELPHVDNETDGLVPFVIAGDLSLIAGLDCEAAVARAEAERPSGVPGPGTAGSGGEPGSAGQAGQGGESGENGQSGATNGGAAPESDAGATSQAGTPSTGEGGAGGAAIPKPPALRVGTLPGLPAGTLAQGYSLLEVAVGCLGAPGFVDSRSEAICGAGYTPSEGSLTAEFVIVSRKVAADMLALQALHASRGSTNLGVRVMPPADAVESSVTLVDNFTEGALRPSEPRRDLANTAYGTTARGWNVEATLNGNSVYSESWSAIKKQSGVTALENGRGYTLIVLGPSYRIDDAGWWNPPAFGLIDNDPPVE